MILALYNRASCALLALAAVLCCAAPSFAVVTVDPPVDVSEYIVSAVTVLGVVVAAVMLAKFGFIVIRAAVKWARGFAG